MGKVVAIVVSTAVCLHIAGNVAAQTVYATPVGIKKVSLRDGRNLVGIPFTNNPSTLVSVLGTNQLPPAATEGLATAVDVWNQNAQTLTNRFWLSSASGFEGWRRGDSFTDASDVPVDSAKGIIITLRTNEGPLSLVLAGVVPAAENRQTVAGNGSYSVVASAFPVQLSITNMGLIASGFQGGESFVESDNILLYDPDSDTFNVKIWYDTLFDVWRDTNANETNPVISAGESFLIRRRAGSSMTWTNPLPYTLNE
ncbi:MAG: hypothetical protein KJ626_09965 [Verrucomicrobia bacterium]|nr:hypothetical protein [Verrucomicrobiota bacterium]